MAPVDDNTNCRCGGLAKNDDRLAINPPEVFNGDLTALVQLKSYSRKSLPVSGFFPRPE